MSSYVNKTILVEYYAIKAVQRHMKYGLVKQCNQISNLHFDVLQSKTIDKAKIKCYALYEVFASAGREMALGFRLSPRKRGDHYDGLRNAVAGYNDYHAGCFSNGHQKR